MARQRSALEVGFAVLSLAAAWGIFRLAGCSPTTTSDVGSSFVDMSNGPYSDLPGAIPGGTVTPSQVMTIEAAFQGAGTAAGAGPCLSEPTIDAMFPSNFSPPLFEWVAPSGQDLFELRLHIENQINDLLLYTNQTSFVLPASIWSALTMHSAGKDVSITLRGGHLQGNKLASGAYSGTTGAVHIAPVGAPGAIVYWTTSGGSALKGFHIGDRTATTVLTPQLMRNATAGDNTQCIGCHSSSPDGLLAFVGRSSSATDFPFSVDVRTVDGTAARPSAMTVTSNALSNLSQSLQFMATLSPAHYGPGDAAVITVAGPLSSSPGPFNLVWTNLLATSGGTGIMARTGDSLQADSPSFSKDGTRIAYTSTNSIAILGMPSTNDIYTIPYNQGAGGAATPVPGASDPAYSEYYPSFSPGDTFLAFNRIPSGQAVYDAPNAEVYIIPSQGGQATRLRANDPPACTGQVSPGLTNSYPRWAPSIMPDDVHHYYWVVFSSKRRPNPQGGAPVPQLFLAAIVTTTESGTETLEQTYPAIYIPSQVETESNHTPAWDLFQIAPAG